MFYARHLMGNIKCIKEHRLLKQQLSTMALSYEWSNLILAVTLLLLWMTSPGIKYHWTTIVTKQQQKSQNTCLVSHLELPLLMLIAYYCLLHSGVCILVKNKFIHSQVQFQADLQAVAVCITINNKASTVASVYVPPVKHLTDWHLIEWSIVFHLVT